MIDLYTIGFTQKSAEDFFKILQSAGVKKLIDIRLWNNSVYAGFTNIRDLPYLCKLHSIEYAHVLDFAPTKEILNDYKNKAINWQEYEKRYIELLNHRNILNRVKAEQFDKSCLLCAEPTAEQCHRRLLAEYLQEHFNDINIKHL